jgi:hypothetical protein
MWSRKKRAAARILLLVSYKAVEMRLAGGWLSQMRTRLRIKIP